MIGKLKTQLARSAKRSVRKIGMELSRVRPPGHELFFLRDHGVKTILDIGANEGQFATLARAALPDASIHSFEPGGGAFAVLSEAATNHSRHFAHKLALGREAGSAELSVSAASPSSSLMPMSSRHADAFPDTGYAATETVEVATLDAWAAGRALDDALAIKLDVQGFELEVVAGGPETIRRAAIVICEVGFVELYQGQPLFDEVHATFRDAGFRCIGVYDTLRDPRNFEMLQADAVFAR